MTHPLLERFLERWTEEFSRVVEAHTKQRPDVTYARVEEPEQWARSSAGLVWWKQEIESGAGAGIWIGAEERSWAALGSASGEGGNAKQSYFELVKQANESLAATAGAGVALETLELLEIRITLGDKTLPPMLAGIGRAAQTLEASSGLPREMEVSRQPAVASASPMLSRLMDLQLPVTVLLGRAVLPIRDVLKISSGSLIELDRQIDDYVEVRVHGTVVARGEIVSVRGNYGVRIKEIISRQERIALQDAA
jgi:flagellar motor switch protein FliN